MIRSTLLFLLVLSCVSCSTSETAATDAGSAGNDAVDSGSVDGVTTDLGATHASATDLATPPDGTTDGTDAANGEIPPADVAATALKGAVFVNEISAGGNKTPVNAQEGDWAEFYNAGTTPADVSGCKLGGPTLGLAGALPLPAGTVIAGGGFLVVYFNHAKLGVPNIDKGLGKAESLTMWDTKDAVVDTVAWTDTQSPTGSTYSRIPDGGPTWKTATPTPGKTNGK